MAICKIKKIEFIGLEKDKDRILGLLQKLGILELIEIKDASPAVSFNPQILPELNTLEIEEAINFLGTFQEKAGFLSSVIKLKPLVYEQQIEKVITTFDHQDLLKKTSYLRNHLKHLTQHKEKLKMEFHLLTPWRRLNIPLEQIHDTEYIGTLLGFLSSKEYEPLVKECAKEKIDLFFEEINQDRNNMYLVIIYLKENFERLENLLKNYHFNFVVLGRHPATVKERCFEINTENLIMDDEIIDTKNEIKKLAKEQFKLMIVYDYLLNIQKRQELDTKLLKQQYTFKLSGWIRHNDLAQLKRVFGREVKDVAIFISQPRPEENVPVDLENNKLIQPFEFITKIYGLPKYNELDPTPFLAPFFFLYFGFCVADVGYGLLLVIFSLIALMKIRLGPGGLRFFRLFLFCGISTIIAGILTGGWFGNLLDLVGQSHPIFLPLKKFKDSLIFLDPLQEPTRLLAIALCFGIIQVWVGNIIAAIGNIKNRRYLDILLDQVSMLLFLFGLTGFGLIFLKLLDQKHAGLFNYTALISAVALILTQGRSEKSLGAKLFYGVFTLYNSISGYLSDILSYSRLWALGLVTGVMANTVNLISIQLSQILVSIVPFINKIGFLRIIISSILLITIFVIGHLVSFLMNLLGAFVHPVRLQFVEFFSKFFKAGGRSFRPLRRQSKYINIV